MPTRSCSAAGVIVDSDSGGLWVGDEVSFVFVTGLCPCGHPHAQCLNPLGISKLSRPPIKVDPRINR